MSKSKGFGSSNSSSLPLTIRPSQRYAVPDVEASDDEPVDSLPDEEVVSDELDDCVVVVSSEELESELLVLVSVSLVVVEVFEELDATVVEPVLEPLASLDCRVDTSSSGISS